MRNLFTVDNIQYSTHTWLPRVKVRTQAIYMIVLLTLLAGMAALPFIKVDISVNAGGLVRPVAEKNELRSLVNGIIDSVLVADGQKVKRGQVLLRLREDASNSRLAQNAYELRQRSAYMHDLKLLAAGIDSGLVSPMYQQEYLRFHSTLAERKAAIQKLKADLDMYTELYKDKVIARKEYQDRKFDYEKELAAYDVMVSKQQSDWQQQLEGMQMESGRLHADSRDLQREKEWKLIKAPVGGTLQQFTGRYTGSSIQAGELLGSISPDSSLIAECYITPRDIGYIKPGMPVKFQVDAFNYNEWGVLEGTVLSVDNDFILVDSKPVFKVKCGFAGTELKMKNGVRGSLKKGMTLQSRFILTRRSLYQLLYDKADDWINPNSNKI